jgi:hypothetical protein
MNKKIKLALTYKAGPIIAKDLSFEPCTDDYNFELEFPDTEEGLENALISAEACNTSWEIYRGEELIDTHLNYV